MQIKLRFICMCFMFACILPLRAKYMLTLTQQERLYFAHAWEQPANPCNLQSKLHRDWPRIRPVIYTKYKFTRGKHSVKHCVCTGNRGAICKANCGKIKALNYTKYNYTRGKHRQTQCKTLCFHCNLQSKLHRVCTVFLPCKNRVCFRQIKAVNYTKYNFTRGKTACFHCKSRCNWASKLWEN